MNTIPSLIVITGRPGSGKTTLAHAISKQMHYPLVSRDEIKEGYINTVNTPHDKLPQDTNMNISNLFFNIIELMLDSQISIVIEAAFQHKVWKQKLEPLFEKGRIKMIMCLIDPWLAKERIANRQNSEPMREKYHGNFTINTLGITEYELPKLSVPTLEVDTTNKYIPGIDIIIEFINNGKI